MRHRSTIGFVVSCGVLLVLIGSATAARAENLFAGNGVYQIGVTDGEQLDKCGTWTAITRELHPAGAGRPLLGLVNGQFPIDLNTTTLRSHNTGVSYTTGGFCTPLCLAVGPPSIEPILREGTVVGYRHRWLIDDRPDSGGLAAEIEFVQELVVEGPVDGTETVDNSAVRETHTITNLGPGRLRFGLQKFWDLLVGNDWGPAFGTCENPQAACDLSTNLSKNGPVRYGRTIVLNPSPEIAECPGGDPPNEPEGCGQGPPYMVAATVQPPTTLNPRPMPPELLQYNAWNFANVCWWPAELNDDSECLPDDFNCFPPFDENCGTALVYYYDLTPESSYPLFPGKSRSYTQYLTAFVDECPAIIMEQP